MNKPMIVSNLVDELTLATKADATTKELIKAVVENHLDPLFEKIAYMTSLENQDMLIGFGLDDGEEA